MISLRYLCDAVFVVCIYSCILARLDYVCNVFDVGESLLMSLRDASDVDAAAAVDDAVAV